ncbi:MAG TPA: helix-turn-helix transcriptional regulator [Actinomycetota bacterium]
MRFARALRAARRRAGLTQRQLAQRARVPQSTVGRIEAGSTDPKVGTLRTLLRACGEDLEALPLLGEGVDRTLISEQLALSPRERLERLAIAAEFMDRIRGRARRAG